MDSFHPELHQQLQLHPIHKRKHIHAEPDDAKRQLQTPSSTDGLRQPPCLFRTMGMEIPPWR
ncbi:hypothetical protein H0H93_016277, partial [Arthromyces matolae]